MKQSDVKKKLSGAEGFDSYYSEIFGERWPSLKQALFSEQVYCQLSYGSDREPYFLDPASVCAALCLPLENAESVLDLCAAPGGKTLVLCGNLGENSILNSNERSPARKQRLDKVVEQSLSLSVFQRVKTSCSDGATWCKRQENCFDSILLDAPCSSERHVLNDEKYLSEWTPSRIKSIAMEQWALLSCAFRLLKKGGWLLYGTCALAVKENEEIVEKLVKKFDDARICPFDEMKSVFERNLESFKGEFESEQNLKTVFSYAEQRKYGCTILPDTGNNCGPLYFCLIEKK